MTHIPATYIGTQHWPAGSRYPSLPLYNLLVAIPGHPVGSTVSLYTLWREGYHPVETAVSQGAIRSFDNVIEVERWEP